MAPNGYQKNNEIHKLLVNDKQEEEITIYNEREVFLKLAKTGNDFWNDNKYLLMGVVGSTVLASIIYLRFRFIKRQRNII